MIQKVAVSKLGSQMWMERDSNSVHIKFCLSSSLCGRIKLPIYHYKINNLVKRINKRPELLLIVFYISDVLQAHNN